MKRICQHCIIGDIIEGECDICGRPDESAPETPRWTHTQEERAFKFAICVSVAFAIVVCAAGLYRAFT